MRILIEWTGLTGYTGDCWRALAAKPGVDLKALVDVDSGMQGGRFSAGGLFHGLDCMLTNAEGCLNGDADRWLGGWVPDVLFVVGWHSQVSRWLADRPWKGTKKVFCFDMPWEWQLRKLVAPLALRRYLRKFAAAFFTGESAGRYARWLGFKRRYPGLVGTELSRFRGDGEKSGGFLYVGRDQSQKGTDILRAAYDIYRRSVDDPWPLECVNGVPPDQLGPIFLRSRAFVLASRWDPWPVVLVEACAAGLPVVCTDRCWNAAELVRGNGIVASAGSVKDFSDAMSSMHRRWSDRAAWQRMCEEGRRYAASYSCEAWSDRVVGICNELMGSRSD